MKKPNKYCDFTGFTTKYQDPKTGLRYYDSEYYQYVTGIPDSIRDDLLSIRKANIVLK